MSKADPKVLERLKRQPEPALDDPDNPEWTEEMVARARPAREVLTPAQQASFRPPGRPKAAVTKDRVTIRLSPRVVGHFRAQGAGWQTRINDALEGIVDQETRKPS